MHYAKKQHIHTNTYNSKTAQSTIQI